MNKENLPKTLINIERRSNHIHSNLYKKKSAKIYLLFFYLFNSVFCFNKLLMKFNLNLFYFIKTFYENIQRISYVDFFFINTNFNIFTLKKKYKKKNK